MNHDIRDSLGYLALWGVIPVVGLLLLVCSMAYHTKRAAGRISRALFFPPH